MPPRTAAAAALTLALVLSGCSASPSPTPLVCREPVDGVLAVRAAGLVFDTACLALPAGEAVTIAFDNADSEPHNIAIYTDSSKSELLFSGDIIDGGETIAYAIDALEPGTYYFECTVHPFMKGTVVVE